MKVVGLTGGIGSGKSTVARVLTVMGYPVYFSDERSKQLLESNKELQEELIGLLGPKLYEEGVLDRKYMAERIFSDDQLRIQINNLIHPRVRADFDQWILEQKKELVFNEAAILIETGSYKRMDAKILVVAPMDLRISRVQERDKVSREEVFARIQKQWSDEKKIPLVDFVLLNDEKMPLIKQIEHTVAQLLIQKSKSRN